MGHVQPQQVARQQHHVVRVYGVGGRGSGCGGSCARGSWSGDGEGKRGGGRGCLLRTSLPLSMPFHSAGAALPCPSQPSSLHLPSQKAGPRLNQPGTFAGGGGAYGPAPPLPSLWATPAVRPPSPVPPTPAPRPPTGAAERRLPLTLQTYTPARGGWTSSRATTPPTPSPATRPTRKTRRRHMATGPPPWSSPATWSGTGSLRCGQSTLGVHPWRGCWGEGGREERGCHRGEGEVPRVWGDENALQGPVLQGCAGRWGARRTSPPRRKALCSYVLATATRLPCAPPCPVPLPWSSSSSCRPCPSHTQARQWRHLVGFLAVVEHRYGLDRAGRLRAGWQRHRRPGPRLPLHPLHEHPRVSSHGHRHHPRHGLVRAVPLCGPHPSYLPLQRLRP